MKLIYLAGNGGATRRLFFDLRQTDGLTPATGEAGGQPQVSFNGAAWENAGIGTLVHIGNGRYYAELTEPFVQQGAGQVESRYKSANTVESPGDSAQIVLFDPNDSSFLGLSSLLNMAPTIWQYVIGQVGTPPFLQDIYAFEALMQAFQLAQDGGIDASIAVPLFWSYASRTLTQNAAQLVGILSGSELTLLRGDTIQINFTGLGSLSGRTKLWFTVKDELKAADDQSVIQIVEGVGLVYFNKAAGVAGQASLTVTDQNLGNVTVLISADASRLLEVTDYLDYDIQMLGPGGVLTKTRGGCKITSDVTRNIS